ncbi:MAG: winged helix DNA-binding domain-containing protein [Rothia sp. (in: high G+C Gram-positive bacteria)]|nr:winged helix DNA-binding domain-containing protein [Rothia sp. (in: high G+C Gram-positive bacteria)]
MIELTGRQLRARRMIAQLLAPSAARPEQVQNLAQTAHYMLCTQGQNYRAGLTGLAVRCGQKMRYQTAAAAGLDAVLNNYQVIRTWPQRGTLHYLHQNDYWMVHLCGSRSVQKDLAQRAQYFSIPLADYSSMKEQVVAACATLKPRSDLKTIVQEYAPTQMAAVTSNLLRYLGASGVLIQGPRAGQEDTFIQTEIALAQNKPDASDHRPPPQQAIREMTRRYMYSRGPARIADLQWWSGLPKTQLTAAVNDLLKTGQLLQVQYRTSSMYMAPWQEEVTEKEINAALRRQYRLPPFDEYLMSYKDRDAIFHSQADRTQVLTSNGISWEFTLANGYITGRSS